MSTLVTGSADKWLKVRSKTISALDQSEEVCGCFFDIGKWGGGELGAV